MMSCTGDTLPMSAPKVMMELRLSMLVLNTSMRSRAMGSLKSVHVHALVLIWLTKWGREEESL